MRFTPSQLHRGCVILTRENNDGGDGDILEEFTRPVRGPEPFAIIGAAAGSCPTRSVSVLHCVSCLLVGRS